MGRKVGRSWEGKGRLREGREGREGLGWGSMGLRGGGFAFTQAMR